MAAASLNVCKFNKTGYCKFTNSCRNQHVNDVCSDANCNGTSCPLRHPRPCKYYSSDGFCKFGSSCAYLHSSHQKTKIEDKINNIENKLIILVASIERIECTLKELNNVLDANKIKPRPKSLKPSTSIVTVCSQLPNIAAQQIPQLDGGALSPTSETECSVVDVSVPDLSFLNNVNVGDCDDCGFCTTGTYESIITMEEYLNHLKTYGRICFNCMDYFLVFSWFKQIHPEYIDDEE